MKKCILFSLFLFCSGILSAQTGEGNNTNGQTPPSYQNPYRDEVTPFRNGNNNQNIFENLNDDKKNGDKKTDKNNSNDKTNSDDKGDNTKEKVLDFSDRNAANEGKSDEELREMYKDDPDYLKYLGLDSEVEENEKDVIKNTEDLAGQVYGSNFLSSGGNISGSNLTTVPADYLLGVGDQLIISVWGAAEFEGTFTISKDGSIFPNRVGKIFLRGSSFEAARNRISSRFRKVLPPGSNIDVIIKEVRSIRVFVLDQVKRPGMITMSALNTPINALQMAGGLTSYGNMRNITIKRNGTVIERIDLYEYLKSGNSGREFYMEDNDIITVGLYEKVVEARGAFKRPMRYQMTEYGTLSNLIDLAGGARFDARKSLIRIKTVYNEQEQYIDINGKDFFSDQDYALKDGDVVTINPINEGVSNVVQVTGSVPYPDEYQLNEGDRIFDLIKKAGGLNPNAYQSRAFVFRNGNTSDESRALKINIGQYGNPSSEENILLQSGDRIQILSESRFDEKFSVSVKGLVRNPGTVTYKTNIRLKDVLILAGGLELEAESGRIEISNVTDSVNRYSITGNNVNVTEVAINPDLSIDKISENIIIKPYDIIFIRKKKDLTEQKLVQIAGEVDYPGPYALLGDEERITSLLIRTGGLKKAAYPEAAKLYRRNYGPVVINLKDAMRNAGGKDDIVLQEGDRVLIPTKDEIVKVLGEVQIPINIKYDKENSGVMNYVDAAGGFGERPWRKRISVKYQNGRLKRTKNFLFFKFYPKVRPGSVVTVPRKPKVNFDINSVLQYGLTTATSVLTLIFLVRNVN
jgi:protein involved in polysaccharide export with SLBB domain